MAKCSYLEYLAHRSKIVMESENQKLLEAPSGTVDIFHSVLNNSTEIDFGYGYHLESRGI